MEFDLPGGRSVNNGFVDSSSGANDEPSSFTLSDATCDIGGTAAPTHHLPNHRTAETPSAGSPHAGR